MYAHQVIDDLKNLHKDNLFKDTVNAASWAKWATHHIINSQNFHIPDGNEILRFAKDEKGNLVMSTVAQPVPNGTRLQ